MKKLRKIIILVLAAAMVLCLTGCGAKNELLGKWETELAIGRFFADTLDEVVLESAADELGVNADGLALASDYFGDMTMPYYLELKSDGTYRLYEDTDTVISEMKTATGEWCVAFYIGILEQMGADVTEFGSTDRERVENILGISIDEYVDELYADALDPTAFGAEGKYKAADGKLWLSAGLEYLPDETMYYTYTLNNGKLTLHDDLGIDEGLEWMYPMTLSYVGATD